MAAGTDDGQRSRARYLYSDQSCSNDNFTNCPGIYLILLWLCSASVLMRVSMSIPIPHLFSVLIAAVKTNIAESASQRHAPWTPSAPLPGVSTAS